MTLNATCHFKKFPEPTGGSIMLKRILAILALALALSASQCWAGPKTAGARGASPGVVPQFCESCPAAPPPITNTFSPGQNVEHVYDFTATGDGKLVVNFDTVLSPGFTLTVTVVHVNDPLPLDGKEFPAGTLCVTYAGNGGQCDRYDFSGNAGGPNNVPVKGKNYKGLITLTLSYDSFVALNPAFGHAPGDITTFTEDILTSYSTEPPPSDPTMGGKVPGLSSVVALKEPLSETGDTFCFQPPLDTLSSHSFAAGSQIEVAFKLFSGGTCSTPTGTPIRDKTARFSLSMTDASGNVTFPSLQDMEEGNKFHWDNKNGLNEFDLSTVGLPASSPGTKYTITVFSSKFTPQNVDITLN